MSPAPDNPPGPGDLVELSVGEAAHGGWCVARPEGHGRVIFVRHALPGERVRAVITQTTSKLARADAVEIIEAAASRVQPPCPQARPGGCGGCDWQHASLPAQRELKAAVVSQQLRRIAGLERQVTVEPVPGDMAGLGWRTRVKFAVRPDGTAGLRKHRSHEVVEVGDCPIAHPLAGAAEVTGREVAGCPLGRGGRGARIGGSRGPGVAPGGRPALPRPGSGRAAGHRRPARSRRWWRPPAPACRGAGLAGQRDGLLAGAPGRG